jgi:CheY-like chemotaxis protein
MLMNELTTTGEKPTSASMATSGSLAQKVVIVNGSPEILELLETALDAGHYDVVFVESSAHAYSQIKLVRPNLVILCVRLDDMQGFQVLTMLKLDAETSQIPVHTYTTEYEGQESEAGEPEPSDPEMFAARPAPQMN